jgi:Sec-independent protein translocase protein TatA
MEEYSKLLTSVAAIIRAIAAPAVILSLILIFRSELKELLRSLSRAIGKLRKAALPGISLELDRIANEEADTEVEKGGKITPRQVGAAARIKVKSQDVGSQVILDELDSLCLEYDGLRRTMPSGTDRTRAMTRVVVKMRSLAPSAVDQIDIYKNSGSPGSRLAAVAMMQMVPQCADLDWLRDRFSSEQPFIFYHAALALQNAANEVVDSTEKQRIRAVAREALDILKRFKGTPDRGTIEVLESLIASLE